MRLKPRGWLLGLTELSTSSITKPDRQLPLELGEKKNKPQTKPPKPQKNPKRNPVTKKPNPPKPLVDFEK